jgi:hypothetical protein
MPTCRLCKREPSSPSSLCKNHLMAKKSLESAYRKWSEGYGGMTWEDYLKKIGQSPETGQWAKEVADMLSKGSID